MTSQKLKKIMEIITRRLAEQEIPVAAIGAMALGLYGLPRYTADVDLMANERDRAEILKIFVELGYTCYHQTDMFAQFDSELGVLGRIDMMFVTTQAGQEMLNRRTVIQDALMGECPVIQPTDYIILKLMGIANEPERGAGDEADILSLLKCFREDRVGERFERLDRHRIMGFAEKFGQKKRMEKLFKAALRAKSQTGRFFL